MTLRYKGYVTYGIRARVEPLGPNWAQNAPTCFTWKYMSTDLWSCAGECGTLAQNHNEDDPLPCQFNVRPEVGSSM